MSDGGKGSSPRPLSIPIEEFAPRFEAIFGKKERKQWVYEEPQKDNEKEQNEN